MNTLSRFPVLALIAGAALLTGCGLAETTVAGAAGAASSAEQAKQAEQQVEQVRKDVEAAQQQAAEARAAAERAAGG
jgi:outer membrane murein-binding lipoprotein Lpp